MQVRCEHDHIEIRMNGTLIIDANVQREEKLRNRLCSGYVGFFNWGGKGNGTTFRNIRIREIGVEKRGGLRDQPNGQSPSSTAKT